MNTLKRVTVGDIDAGLRFVRAEAQTLRGRREQPAWATRKATQFDELEAILKSYRQQQQMKSMSGGNLEVEALEKELRQAQSIIRQVSRDTFGREMTPKEFAEASSYDS